MHYTKSAHANYYDCDAANRLKISAAMRYMQQTSSEHLEALDLSPVKLCRQGLVFLLSKMCIKVNRMPQTAEEIRVGTAPTETRGARFVREFVIDSPEGERMISALSLWLLVDTETHKILRPARFPYPLPFSPTLLKGEIEDMKIPKLLGSGETVKEKILVRYSHIDTNHHVNNSVYADFICDVLPYQQLTENGLDMLIINFINEAKQGDRIELAATRQSQKEYHIMGSQESGIYFEAFVKMK